MINSRGTVFRIKELGKQDCIIELRAGSCKTSLVSPETKAMVS